MILPADTGKTTTANVWLAVKGGEPSSATVTVTRLMEPSGPGLVQVITPAGLMETPGGADRRLKVSKPPSGSLADTATIRLVCGSTVWPGMGAKTGGGWMVS